MRVEIHNARKVTFDGRDCFIVALENDRGGLLFVPATGCYDPEATSEHSTLGEALAHAKDLATRRGAAPITLTKDDGTRERIAP